MQLLGENLSLLDFWKIWIKINHSYGFIKLYLQNHNVLFYDASGRALQADIWSFWHCFMAGQQWLLRDKTEEHTKMAESQFDDSFRRCLQGSHALPTLPWRRIVPWCSWRRGDLPLADPRGGARDAPPPGGPNSFIFMQFSVKNWKIIAFLGVGAPPLGKILDPPLPSIVQNNLYHFFNDFLVSYASVLRKAKSLRLGEHN